MPLEEKKKQKKEKGKERKKEEKAARTIKKINVFFLALLLKI